MSNETSGSSPMHYQPTLTQLRAFVAVARHQHFSSAANELGVSQPTLSQALSSLEQGLNIQLMERSTRRVIMTGAGHALLGQAENVLDAVNVFSSSAAGVSSGTFVGQLRLGIIPTLAPYLLPTLLPMFSQSQKNHSLTVVEDQTQRLVQSLRIGSIDVALVSLDSRHNAQNMVEIPLFVESLGLITPVNHPLGNRTDVKLTELETVDVLLLEEGHCLRDQAIGICRSVYNDKSPEWGETRASSLCTIVQCVAGGLGVSFIPEMAIPIESQRGDIAHSRFAEPEPVRTIGLIYRASTVRVDIYKQLGLIVQNAVRDRLSPKTVIYNLDEDTR